MKKIAPCLVCLFLLGFLLCLLPSCGNPEPSPRVEGDVHCEGGKLVACGSVMSGDTVLQGGICTTDFLKEPSKPGAVYWGSANFGSVLAGTIFGDTNGNAQADFTYNPATNSYEGKASLTCADGSVRKVAVGCTNEDNSLGGKITCLPKDNSVEGAVDIIASSPNGTSGTIGAFLRDKDGCTSAGVSCKGYGNNGGFFTFEGGCQEGASPFIEFFCGKAVNF